MAKEIKLVRVLVDFENQKTEYVVRYTKSTPFGEFEEDTTVRTEGCDCLDAAAVAVALADTMAKGKRVTEKKPQLSTIDLAAIPEAPPVP